MRLLKLIWLTLYTCVLTVGMYLGVKRRYWLGLDWVVELKHIIIAEWKYYLNG